ncbi:hypothetical protein CHS0354_036635 [Potamilus streckersoni]|uniref:Single-stranded DNA-binding protein n=1 Tax=Potamilus streckersoni TaxID=2493646 RepID=A0AAE0SRE4_9BIVA|nr:hypothetical protein CHS0354_036635 [Potamilus streckersoni]
MLRNLFKQFAAVTGRTITRSYCAEAEEIPRRGREKYVNTVTLLGRVGRDAEMRGIGENQVLVFSLATNPNYDTGADRTAWHRILVSNFRVRDSLANRVEKGDRLLVIGRIQYDQYTDAQQTKRTATTIVANDVIVVSKRRQQRNFSGEDDDLEDVTRGRQQRRFAGNEEDAEDFDKGRQQRKFSGGEEDVEEEDDSVKRTR